MHQGASFELSRTNIKGFFYHKGGTIGQKLHNVEKMVKKNIFKKSIIRETLNLSTDADSSTNRKKKKKKNLIIFFLRV